MDKLHAIGRRVAKLRRAAKMTQADLAAQIGVSRSVLGEIEGGTQPGGLSTMVAIADIFRVPLDWLLYREVPPGGPLVAKFVYEPDTLAWVAFWEGLGPDDRTAAIRMLRLPPVPATA